MTQLIPLHFFKYLSDETRLRIMLLLRETGELCVCDISTALQEQQSKTSRHLAMLREAGLLLDRREGKWIYYRLSPHIPVWAANVLEQAFQCQQVEIAQLSTRLQKINSTTSGKSVCQ
ncbi:metalloregulator ArsR/SmtB family transcription factor [Xenorhabdus hominickii]|uniref:Arsenical resistance operon repressor n=1 Tax=Xenorhabdus hominickii TaxID=351679 RepID=A0A2G0QDH6_XENHO|nr:metalloregulator ArsR/SmtB family transcription factor [Xenorhabdus hominickii]AOM41355.1 transcriptional regulator [Xenorhabdus hominickii]PHM55374.1 nodulation protein NOLR [Xenorhabdus hominickii]PHM57261.1 nodulation protein NOLR [Xenorhabdus hominickii]